MSEFFPVGLPREDTAIPIGIGVANFIKFDEFKLTPATKTGNPGSGTGSITQVGRFLSANSASATNQVVGAASTTINTKVDIKSTNTSFKQTLQVPVYSGTAVDAAGVVTLDDPATSPGKNVYYFGGTLYNGTNLEDATRIFLAMILQLVHNEDATTPFVADCERFINLLSGQIEEFFRS